MYIFAGMQMAVVYTVSVIVFQYRDKYARFDITNINNPGKAHLYY